MELPGVFKSLKPAILLMAGRGDYTGYKKKSDCM